MLNRAAKRKCLTRIKFRGKIGHRGRDQPYKFPQGITKKQKENTMRNVKFDSSAISSASYDNDTLKITFNSGGTYEYSNVPQDTFDRFVSSDSAGRFFTANISGKFDSSRVR